MTARSVRRLQIAAVLLAALSAPVMLGVVVAGADPVWPGDVAASATLTGFLLLLASPFLGPAAERPALWRMGSIWMWVSGITHVTWELGWCLVHQDLHGVTGEDTWAWVWWIYGLADARYVISDPFIVILEWCTAVLGGPMNAYVLWLLAKGRDRDGALWVIVVSMMELYGTVLYFGSEAFNGWHHVDTVGVVNLWVKFVGMNVVWIVFPALSIVGAFRELRGPAPVPRGAPALVAPGGRC